jgi:hypothetical protein
MPTQIDYNKRGIMQNIFDPGAWRNLLGGVSEIVSSVAEVKSAWELLEEREGSQPLQQTTPEPTYNPNLTASDFAFTPNVTLLAIGGVLLIVALIISRR